MTVMKWVSCIVPILEFVGRAHGQAIVQIQVQPQIVGRSIRDGQVTTVFLAPRYVTAIRMPEPINSVVVGDPSSFSAEHSDREPNLVFVKPITPKVAQTNLLISSTRGLQTSLLLVSRGELKEEGQPSVDFLMRYKPAGQFLIQPADSPSAAIPQTVTVGSAAKVPFGACTARPSCTRLVDQLRRFERPSDHAIAGGRQFHAGGQNCARRSTGPSTTCAIAGPLRPEARYLAAGQGTGEDRRQRSDRSRQCGGGLVRSRKRSGPCRRIDAAADSVGRHEEGRDDHSQVALVDV